MDRYIPWLRVKYKGSVSTPTGPVLLIRAPHSYVPERRYIFDLVLSEWLGFEYDLAFDDGRRVAIQLAGDPQGRELTLPDVLFGTSPEKWLTEASIPILPLARLAPDARPSLEAGHFPDFESNIAGPGGLPILFGLPHHEGSTSHLTDAGLSLTLDVFGSVFYLLTRYEEVFRTAGDAHERFPGSASVAMVEGFLERPIADEYVDVLWISMLALWPTLIRRPTTFRLRLTHDVDQPWATLGQGAGAVARALVGDLVKRRDPTLAARRARSFVSAQAGRVDHDPFDTFDILMETSERYGLQSVFYVLAGGAAGDFDARYDLSDPPVADLLRRIHERGHEVGLHASYASFRSAERTRMEFDALQAACRKVGFDQPTWGVRQHYLRFENPQTWRNHESAGLEHDSTLGFADKIGFRAGTCREYPVFDLRARRRLMLRERPLVVMDTTLFEYMGLEAPDAAARTRAIVDLCRRHGGDAVLLYHNNTLAGHVLREHYIDLIESLARPS